MPQHQQRQPHDGPTRLVNQTEAARIIGVKRQNLAPWVPYLDAEEHAGRWFYTRSSAERARDIRAARLANAQRTEASTAAVA